MNTTELQDYFKSCEDKLNEARLYRDVSSNELYDLFGLKRVSCPVIWPKVKCPMYTDLVNVRDDRYLKPWHAITYYDTKYERVELIDWEDWTTPDVIPWDKL